MANCINYKGNQYTEKEFLEYLINEDMVDILLSTKELVDEKIVIPTPPIKDTKPNSQVLVPAEAEQEVSLISFEVGDTVMYNGKPHIVQFFPNQDTSLVSIKARGESVVSVKIKDVSLASEEPVSSLYKLGEQVMYKGSSSFVESFPSVNTISLKTEKGIITVPVSEVSKVRTAFTPTTPVVTTEEEKVEVDLVQEENLRKTRKVLSDIGTHMRTVFPSVTFKFVREKADWVSRISNGVIEINELNTKITDGQAVIHEFLHPFFITVKEENPELYNNLVEDIKSKKDYNSRITQLKKSPAYSSLPTDELNDELLTRDLSSLLKTLFNEDGSVNTDNLLERNNYFSDNFKRFLNSIIKKIRQFLNLDRDVVSTVLKDLTYKYNGNKNTLLVTTGNSSTNLLPLASSLKTKEENEKRSLSLRKETDKLKKEIEEVEDTLSPDLSTHARKKIVDSISAKKSEYENLIGKLTRIETDSLYPIEDYLEGFKIDMDGKIYKVSSNAVVYDGDKLNTKVDGWEDVLSYLIILRQSRARSSSERGLLSKAELKDYVSDIKNKVSKVPSSVTKSVIITPMNPTLEDRSKGYDFRVNVINPNFSLKDISDLIATQKNIQINIDAYHNVAKNITSPLYYVRSSEQLKYFVKDLRKKAINLTRIGKKGVEGGNDAARQYGFRLQQELKPLTDAVIESDGVTNIIDLFTISFEAIQEANMLIRDSRKLMFSKDVESYIRLLSASLRAEGFNVVSHTGRGDKFVIQGNTVSINYDDIDFIPTSLDKYIGDLTTNFQKQKIQELHSAAVSEASPAVLTSKQINDIHKDLFVASQLYATFNNFNQSLLDEYKASLLFGTNEDFVQVLEDAVRQKEVFESTMQLAVTEWLYPYFNKLQKETLKDLSEEETNEKLISKKDFQKLLKITNMNPSLVNHLFSAIVNSEDPINATVGVMISEKINHNREDLNKMISNNKIIVDAYKKKHNIKDEDLEEYIKTNFLREIEVTEALLDPHTKMAVKDADGNQVFGKVKKWAFHTEYDDHLIKEHLREWAVANPSPAIVDGFDMEFEEYKEWSDAKDEFRDSILERFHNPVFKKLMATDELFKMLYTSYNSSNSQFGEVKLQFGIIPQKYKDTSIKERLAKAKKKATDLKDKIVHATSNKDIHAIDKVGGYVNAIETSISNLEYVERIGENNDDTYYKSIKTKYLDHIPNEDLDFNVVDTIIYFREESLRYNTLRSIQANIDNLRTLINGNTEYKITGRQSAVTDSNGNVSFTKILGNRVKQEAHATRLNKQLNEFIDDVFYGETADQKTYTVASSNDYKRFIKKAQILESKGVSQADILKETSFYKDDNNAWQSDKYFNIKVTPSKISKNLAFYTSVNALAGNISSTIKNLTIGNYANFSEGYGSKYFKNSHLREANAVFFKNPIDNVMGGITGNKTKFSQLVHKYQAVQGEYRNRVNKLIKDPNLINRLFSTDNLFAFQHVAEMQIQGTAMVALMKATPVLIAGVESNLWEAYNVNANGLIELNKKAIFSSEDEAAFTRKLHEMNRQNHGNFSDLHKTHIQRQWYGQLALGFRKHLYPTFTARFGKEKIDYSKGYITKGFHRIFFNKLGQDLKEYGLSIKDYDIFKLDKETNTDWTNAEIYGFRRSVMESASVLTSMLLVMLLLAVGDDDDDEDSFLKDTALVIANNFYSSTASMNPLGIFNPLTGKSETGREIVNMYNNPLVASHLLKNVYNVFDQLTTDPFETYTQTGNSFEKGDSKLFHQTMKIVPVFRQIEAFAHPEYYLQYQSLLGKNLEDSKK